MNETDAELAQMRITGRRNFRAFYETATPADVDLMSRSEGVKPRIEMLRPRFGDTEDEPHRIIFRLTSKISHD